MTIEISRLSGKRNNSFPQTEKEVTNEILVEPIVYTDTSQALPEFSALVLFPPI
jgi:hypothetical protein